MELLTNIIIEYLKHNKRLVVPKLGAFIVKRGEESVVFSELMRNDDGVLRSLLVAYGMKELEANGAIDRLVFEIHHAIGQGNNYTIEGLGEFKPGPNDTTIFKQLRKPTSVGGSIRPPVEKLREEQIKIQRRRQYAEQRRERRTSPNATTTLRSHAQKSTPGVERTTKQMHREELDPKSIYKPDSTLRGLRYDSSKNKKRDDGTKSSTNRGLMSRRSLVVTLLVAIIAAIATWFAWSMFSHSDTHEGTATPIEQQTTPIQDSLSVANSQAEAEEIVQITTEEASNDNKPVE